MEADMIVFDVCSLQHYTQTLSPSPTLTICVACTSLCFYFILISACSFFFLFCWIFFSSMGGEIGMGELCWSIFFLIFLLSGIFSQLSAVARLLSSVQDLCPLFEFFKQILEQNLKDTETLIYLCVPVPISHSYVYIYMCV